MVTATILLTMINSLSITQLVENTAGSPGLLAEHGVAFYIETDEHRLLFDTGQGLALRHNAAILGIPIASVEAIILSHGHYDHAGGLSAALEMTGPVDLYLHPKALTAKFNHKGQEISAFIAGQTDLGSLAGRTFDTQGPTEIFSGIHVTGEIPRTHKIEDTGGPFYQNPECTRPDTLPDDQALFIETPEGLIVLLGCGHSGVVNTLEYVQQLSDNKPIHAVIGGMHLLRATPERLAFTGDRLNDLAVGYLAPNHCTGLEAVCYIKSRFPGAFHQSQTGTIHTFGSQ